MAGSIFKEQLERLKKAASVKTDIALASALGIASCTISNAKTAGRIPSDWFIRIAEKTGESLDFLYYGAKGDRLAREQAAENRRLLRENAELRRITADLRARLARLRQEP